MPRELTMKAMRVKGWGRTPGSSQKQFAVSVDFQDPAESLLCCGQALFGALSCGATKR